MCDRMAGKWNGRARSVGSVRAYDPCIIPGIFDFFDGTICRALDFFLQELVAANVINVKMGVDDCPWSKMVAFQQGQKGSFFLASCIDQDGGIAVHVDPDGRISDFRCVSVPCNVFHSFLR